MSVHNLLRNIRFRQSYSDFCQIIEYREYKTGQGKMYQAVVKEFLEFHEQKGYTELVFTKEEMTTYLSHLLTRDSYRGGHLSPNTIKHHLFGIRLYLEMLMDMELIDSYPQLPKLIRPVFSPPPYLEESEIEFLFGHCHTSLEKAFLSVAYGCALRRTELESLNIEDVHLNSAYIIIRNGKGLKRREVPMADFVRKNLINYWNDERQRHTFQHPMESAFFLNSSGTRLMGQGHYRLLKSIIHHANNEEIIAKKITLHSLRRSMATHLVNNGADIYFIRNFLGHQNINTTQLYAIRKRKRITYEF